MGYLPELDPTAFYNNPTVQALTPYTAILGMFFYIIILIVMNGLLLYKYGWQLASISTILTSLLFTGVFSSFPYIIWIWVIAAVFVFAAIVTDTFMNKQIG